MGIYLYSGKDTYRMETALKDLLKKHGIDKEHCVSFDGAEKKFNLEAAIIECGALSLFAEDTNKAVLIKEPSFLNSGGGKKSSNSSTKKKTGNTEQDQRLELLTSYFNNENPDTDLIFYCSSFDADSRKKEYKLIAKYATVVSFKVMKEYEFEGYLDEQLKKNKITCTKDARNELALRVNNNTMDLHNAIEKIKLYGIDHVTLEDVQHLVSLNPDVNSFRMADSFLKGNLTLALRSKDEMLEVGYTYQALISMMASKIRSSYNMKLLFEQGFTQEEIATRLRANPYAVKFSLQAITGTSSKKLLRYLKELADIDQGIKSGQLDAKNGFENFLIRNGARYASNSRTL